ncbi:tau 95 subunit of transcription factor TFIIIC [Apophysomyces ossiformis]|uniref:Tau 95 subunit of transcription factor TFIIIC n=1 Tax=Apophysomyces ossiformis TaxID=679940 RepID=A0A8H7EPD4_9FUNG|nr:tau 95 subunit of transcription factor TFIIIC [Apophysomyces ossiformis]
MELDYELASTIPISDKKFICVEYPGYVKNVDRALNTFGGEKALATAITNQKAVELRFRSKDPFSHPINGDIVPTANLLVKVTRRVKKGRPEEEAVYKTEIVGTIPKTCRFRGEDMILFSVNFNFYKGLADFQYLVPKTDAIGQLKNAMTNGDVDTIIKYKIADDDDDFKNLRNVPPPVFSTIETPMKYNYAQNAPVVRVRVRQPDGSYTVKLVNRSTTNSVSFTMANYEDENILFTMKLCMQSIPTKSKKPLKNLEGTALNVEKKIAKDLDAPFDFDIEEGLADAIEKEKTEETADEGLEELDLNHYWETGVDESGPSAKESNHKQNFTAMVDDYMKRLQEENLEDLAEYEVFGDEQADEEQEEGQAVDSQTDNENIGDED